MSSKHGQEMSDAFQKAETARRERLGKTTEAPRPEVKPPMQMAEEERPFVNKA
jgi:hypothetical protein